MARAGVPSPSTPAHASGTFAFLPLASGIQLVGLQSTLGVTVRNWIWSCLNHFQVSKFPAPSQAFASLVRCFFPAPLYLIISPYFPFSGDYQKASRLDTWISKRPSFRLSVRKQTESLECLYAGPCRLNVCRICWCFEVRTLGEFSTPSSPLW